MTFSQQAEDVLGRAIEGQPGMPGDVGRVYTDDGLNASPQAKQVTVVTITGATNDKTYTIVVNGVSISYTADGTATVTEIAAGLKDAIDGEVLVRGQVVPSSALGVLTLTGIVEGLAFTVTEADAEITVATTTSAADAADIPFGRGLINTGFNTGEAEKLVALPSTALFSAQVATLAISYILNAKITVAVYERRGAERVLLASVTETSATDQDTTIDTLVASLEAALPANTVSAAADTDPATAIVFTAEIPGFEFEIEFSRGDEGASIPAMSLTATTGPSRSTSLHRAFAGVSKYSTSDEAATIGGTEGVYEGASGVIWMTFGAIWVYSEDAPVESDSVYLELAAGATAGRFYNAASATRVALERRVARWLRSSGTVALLQLEA